MKKIFLRLVTVLLTLSVLLGSIAGCGNILNSDTETTNLTSESSPTEITESSASLPDTAEDTIESDASDKTETLPLD